MAQPQTNGESEPTIKAFQQLSMKDKASTLDSVQVIGEDEDSESDGDFDPDASRDEDSEDDDVSEQANSSQMGEAHDDLSALEREDDDASDEDYDPDASRDEYGDDLADDQMNGDAELGRPDFNEVKEELAGLKQNMKDDELPALARAALAQAEQESLLREHDRLREEAFDSSEVDDIQAELKGLRQDQRDPNVMILARAALARAEQEGIKQEDNDEDVVMS
ncbi:hypothetical protein CF326_g1177 [Tilletia indica]|nr:hypothetical protein CF326_g1177 [Tilletia indica]